MPTQREAHFEVELRPHGDWLVARFAGEPLTWPSSTQGLRDARRLSRRQKFPTRIVRVHPDGRREVVG